MAKNLKFKKIAAVTLQLFKMKSNTEYYFKFIGPMHVGKEIPAKPTVDEKTGEVKPGVSRAPATLAHVINLETGEEGQIICATILHKELNAAYPNDAYIGKCFEISMQKVDGKNYNLVQIAEVAEPEPDEPEQTESEEAAPKATKKK